VRDKPHAPACDRNRDPILTVLREYFAGRRSALEIGSGTGQHAVYFAAALTELLWQCSDVEENLPGIRAWRPLRRHLHGQYPAYHELGGGRGHVPRHWQDS
jgi:hypothetical protein